MKAVMKGNLGMTYSQDGLWDVMQEKGHRFKNMVHTWTGAGKKQVMSTTDDTRQRGRGKGWENSGNQVQSNKEIPQEKSLHGFLFYTKPPLSSGW